MDYEKKYNEALERAKELLDSPRTCFDIVQLKDIFPELRESEDEDERIRKWLVQYIKDTHPIANYWNGAPKIPDVLAWLEKQKEQKPDIEICPHSIKSKSYLETGYPIGQKPAEKQDHSGLTDLERAIHRGFLCAGVENVPVGIIKETAQDCLAHMPAWSEEDERMLDSILAELANHICYNKPLDGMPSGTGWTSYKYQQEMDWLTNRLKSLRPPFKPSEEDERVLKGIIGKIDHDQTYGVSKDEMLNFLKKL